MELKKDEVLNLIAELKIAAEVYYQGSSQTMTDEEYDTKLDYLSNQLETVEDEEIKASIEELLDSVSAGSVPVGTTVIHDYPMLSLAKAKDYSELQRYHSKLVAGGATGFILQMKLDGLALSAKYSKGKLVELATRGDGVSGDLLNHLISNADVKITGLPTLVENKSDFEIRGELYISDKQFDVINQARFAAVGEEFSNSRNAVVGIVRRAMNELGYNAEISFTAYSAHKDGGLIDFNEVDNNEEFSKVVDLTEKEVKRLSTEDLGMKTCIVKSTKREDLEQAIDTFGKLRESFGIPTDGVVIKPINEIKMLNKMGFTSKFPIAYIAFKYPGAKAITTVESIIVSVGKTGRLTPQAKVTPVEVGGVVISNITCHNYSWLNEMGIRVGSKISVTRANDVIPAIDSVITTGDSEPLKAPKSCPECDFELKSDGSEFPRTLSCVNEACPSRLLYYMRSIVERKFLYIEGLGGVALEALINNGVITSVIDLFSLEETKIAKVPTGVTSTGNVRQLGAGNAKNIMKSINEAKKNTDSNKLLAALNIPGMGPGTAKRLIAHFGGIEDVLRVNPKRLKEVSQVGEGLTKGFHKHQERALSQFLELVDLGVQVNDPVKDDNKKESKGTFSVSGSVEGFANRDDFVEHMEADGWEFHKSPKKDTDVLFADPNGTSSKVKKAKANGTRVIESMDDL